MDKYDVAIIGAGIAGSCLAILLAQQGKSVVIFEKDSYPSHKVCGEFVSLESYNFFKELGLPLDDWNLPIIKKLKLTSQKGRVLDSPLKMGGFGISRYKLDYELSQLFVKNKIAFYPEEKITSVSKNQVQSKKRSVEADLIIGSHGKYSASYLKTPKTSSTKTNYIGVKYHIKGDFENDLISLHSFRNGYCGMSKIEDDLYCLCYLVDSKELKQNNNSISQMEENVLFQNAYLKALYSKAEFQWNEPLIISNIKFEKNKLEDQGVLLLGDAAGAISPLSGNGMSIAAKTALLLSQVIEHSSEKELVNVYNKHWDNHFGSRINKARILNTIMLNPNLHHVILGLLSMVKPLRNKLVNDMQGPKFVRNTKLFRYL